MKKNDVIRKIERRIVKEKLTKKIEKIKIK